MTASRVRRVREESKPLPASWKEPEVVFRRFGPSAIEVQLDFYVDNIRLEHFERKDRVLTEVARAVHRRLAAEGIAIPLPPVEVSLLGRPAAEPAQPPAPITAAPE